MEDKTFTIRVPKSWARIALIVAVTALIVAPLTAVATHSFTDVPDTNTFHADIEWLADTGVTKGCNPPDNTEFCPDDFVTRAQMSAFMRRLAENQVVDAATVQGQTVDDIIGDVDLSAILDRLDSLESQVSSLEADNAALQALLEGVSRDGDILLFEGMNLQVVNGQGGTQSTNGLGNIIVGYNEDQGPETENRDGSHNLVVGMENAYSSFGGLVTGVHNSITNEWATVTGGASNTASGASSSVSGGRLNTASGRASSVSGGEDNTADEHGASVSSGLENTASGVRSSVLGGNGNTTTAFEQCIPTCP